MAKLDENYLEIVRQSLYNKASVLSRRGKPLKKLESTNIINSKGEKSLEPFKKQRQTKHVTFSSDIKHNLEPQSSGDVKSRICTPFKSFTQRETVISENPSTLLLNSDSINKGKKRRLSISDTVEMVKRKKKKPTNSDYNNGLSSLHDFKIKKKSLKKNTKIKDKKKLEAKIKHGLITFKSDFIPSLKSDDLNTDIKAISIKPTLNGEKFANIPRNLVKKVTSPVRNLNQADKVKFKEGTSKTISNVELKSNKLLKHPKKKKVVCNITDIVETSSYSAENNTLCAEDAADFYDNENITVNRMKFKNFTSLFPYTHNKQLQRTNNTLRVPQKYFKVDLVDDFDWKIEVSVDSRVAQPVSPDLGQSTSSEEKLNGDSLNSSEIEISENLLQNPQEITKESNLELAQTIVTQNNTNTMSNKPVIITLKNASKIVILPHLNQTIHFNGLCYLDVLNGEVEILGANLSKNSGQRKVYSPRGTSLLYIKNTTTCSDTRLALKDLISEELLNENDQSSTFAQHCAILLCKELKECHIEFIENHISQIIFPESTPRVNFELSGSWNKTRVSDLWTNVVETLSEDSKTVFCGGKGVGKSTFLRFTVNRLLRKFKKIRIVELDPGQSEFYPPGCISVATVDQDVLGPNYTHLQSADRLVLSNINVGYNVKQYLKSVQYLLDTMEAKETMPTLINFPGFTNGLGLDIAANTLKLLQPTHVIEIKSKTFSKNYKVDMTAENVNNVLERSKLLDQRRVGNQLNYSFKKFESFSEKNEAWSLEARQARELCILSYFGKTLSGNGKDLTSSDNLFSIQISALAIINLEGKHISPLAINGSVVALCSTTLRYPNIFEAHGYGFVRGIDLDDDALVLLTPEPIENLENVSHLVLGSVTTPPSLLMSVSAVKGHIPFVSMGDLIDFGQLTKRSYLPPKK